VYKCVAKPCAERAVLKEKSNYALAAGNKLYAIIAKRLTITPVADEHVHVQESVEGTAITLTAVHESKADMLARPCCSDVKYPPPQSWRTARTGALEAIVSLQNRCKI
jgi:hypothetical protein